MSQAVSKYFLGIILLISSCAKDFNNPYDSATSPDVWMPSGLEMERLDTNALRLIWQQTETHIDGFLITKTIGASVTTFFVESTVLELADAMVIPSIDIDTCTQVNYTVQAQAGENVSSAVSLNIVTPIVTTANAGDDRILQDTTLHISLSASQPRPDEQGTWQLVSGNGEFSNENSPESLFSGTSCTESVLVWSIEGRCSISTDTVRLIFNQETTQANAGSDITANTDSIPLSANAPKQNETGSWSIVLGDGGQFVNADEHNTVFIGQICSSYTLRWTLEACNGQTSDDVVVDLGEPSITPDAGPDQSYTDNTTNCQLMATLLEGQTGEWSVYNGNGGSFSDATSPTSIFYGVPCESYQLRWSITDCGGTSSDYVFITFDQQTTQADAGPDQSFSDNTVQAQLSANAPAPEETGEWSVYNGNGGSFSDATSPTSVFYGIPCESYQLRWSITDCGGTSSDYVFIIFDQQTTQADAGPDQSFSDNTVQAQLSANAPAPEETGEWSVYNGNGGSFSDATSPTSIFYGIPCESYQLRWSITDCGGTSSDYVFITFDQQTTQADAGPDQSFSDNTVQTQLSGNTPAPEETGQWSVWSGIGGSFSDANSPNSIFYGQPSSNYQLRWSIGGCSSTTDYMNVQFN